MLQSMTGFGTSVGTVQGVEYDVEVRSVNNRYLKISMRTPESLQPLEAKIEQKIRGRLQRGTVNLSIRMKVPDEEAVYKVNSTVLNSYLDQIRPLKMDANPILRLDIGAMLQLPGVCQPPRLEELAAKTADGLLTLVEDAMDKLMEMRSREGQAIVNDLETNSKIIEQNLEAISQRTDDVLKLYHEKLQTRVDELLSQSKLNINEETLAREVAIFAERSDIAEEISRLTMHLKEFRMVCQADEPMGRKLDFMAQEMLREANTIASKGSDADIAHKVVNIKTAIDRIKEQAANVE
jgi:uncharacterized protein (TIGR00255 family)